MLVVKLSGKEILESLVSNLTWYHQEDQAPVDALPVAYCTAPYADLPQTCCRRPCGVVVAPS